MQFQNEHFTELKLYPSYYVSKTWMLIKKTKNGIRVCSQTPNSKQDPYWTVTVKDMSGKYVKRFMHRLLMETFVPNPENKAHVNHINGDKACRELSNLEWATPKENAIHAYKTGLSVADYNYIPVHQYYLNGEYIASYPSTCIAYAKTKVAKPNISKCTLGKRDQAGGFMWTTEKQPKLPPLGRKIVSHFKVTDLKSNQTKKYKYIGLFSKNPNPKAAHPLLEDMGDNNTLRYGKFLIERIYYK